MFTECIIWLVSAAFGAGSFLWLVRRYPSSVKKPNYQSKLIPSIGGIILVLSCETAYLSTLFEKKSTEPRIAWTGLLIVLAFGILGLVDDLYGDRSVGGLKGHFREFRRTGRLTTGGIKAAGGAAAALVGGLILHNNDIFEAVLAALLIALCANALNLMDTRPGRCLGVGLLIATIGAVIGPKNLTPGNLLLFAPPYVVAILLFLLDRSAILMIGDVGANAIGALLGVFWAVVVPIYGQIALLMLLIWFHWWTESHSLSKAIEQTRWLKRLDRIIGVRG